MARNLLVFALVLGSFVVAGCGGSSGDDADVVIEIKAANIRFVPDQITIPAGKIVTLSLKNVDEMEHDLEVPGLLRSRRSCSNSSREISPQA